MSSPPYPTIRVRVYSESPFDDLWSYLRRFEVIDWVKSQFSASTENAEVVGDCVRQAREYFRAAHTSALLTRPNLAYYGMVSLGKVLFLLDPQHPLSMADIEKLEREGHGLSQHDAKDDPGDTYPLERAEIRVVGTKDKNGVLQPRGVFPRLADTFQPGVSANWLDRRVPLNTLLRAIPQVDLQMRQAFGEDQGYSGLFVELQGYSGLPGQGLAYHLEIPVAKNGLKSPEEAQERTKYLDWNRYALSHATGSEERYFSHIQPEEAYRMMVREELAGSTYAIPPALLGSRLDSLLAQYMVMYGLSIVARYKPHRWAQILGGKTSPLLPVLERLMFISERWWPNLLLNHLTRSWIVFAVPSYWG